MTGFSNFIRKLVCLPPKKDHWEDTTKSKRSLLTPAKFKVAVRNERQIGQSLHRIPHSMERNIHSQLS